MSPVSFFSLHLELYKNGDKIGDGTGFIYEEISLGKKFLITNYHVLTCRYPKNPESLLKGYPDSPDEIRFFIFNKRDYIAYPKLEKIKGLILSS